MTFKKKKKWSLSPPSPQVVGRYLVFVTAVRRNQSAAASAVAALQYVSYLNNWESVADSVYVRVPKDAASRAFAAPTRKAPAIEAWMVVAIVRACCGADEPAPLRMFGYAVLACFMVVGRFDDLCHLRFDSGYFEVHATHLRFFFDRRKNDQNYSGHWVDVATSDAGSASFPGFSAVAHLRAAAAFLGDGGPVLRRVWKRGATPFLAPPFFMSGNHAGLQCNMLYKDFVARLRAALVSCCGLSNDDAREYSTHGIRAGAATTLVKARVPEHIIKDRAGVVAADWIECYDRVELARRLECSRALGL